jgi:hypothetical protein
MNTRGCTEALPAPLAAWTTHAGGVGAVARAQLCGGAQGRHRLLDHLAGHGPGRGRDGRQPRREWRGGGLEGLGGRPQGAPVLWRFVDEVEGGRPACAAQHRVGCCSSPSACQVERPRCRAPLGHCGPAPTPAVPAPHVLRGACQAWWFLPPANSTRACSAQCSNCQDLGVSGSWNPPHVLNPRPRAVPDAPDPVNVVAVKTGELARSPKHPAPPPNP